MSDLILIIGNKNYSSWSLRPWILMKYYKISFREVRVALFKETTNGELENYNSDYKVPILKNGELLVWDSLSILEYISETFLEFNGWPQDPSARVMARSISHEMHSSFTNVRNEFPMNCRKQFSNITPSKAALREIERIQHLWVQAREQYGQGGDWLFGDYSIADAMFAPMVLRFYGYNIVLDQTGNSYIDTVLKQADMIDWIKAGSQETEIIERDEA